MSPLKLSSNPDTPKTLDGAGGGSAHPAMNVGQ